MTKYSLTERQKNIIYDLAKEIEDGTVRDNGVYNVKYDDDEFVLLITPDQLAKNKWLMGKSNIKRSDFDQFIENGFFKYQGEKNYKLSAQKIIDAVKSNFEEDEISTIAQKIEAVFGEPSSDPDFQCDIFVMMPFRSELDNVFNVLKTIANDLNIVMKRGDEFSSLQNVVINDIWSAINHCRLVIADCTATEKTVGDTSYKEINGNVYYEIGIADALHKPVLLLTRNMDEIPFDLKHRRFVVYQHAYNLNDTLKPTIVKMLKITK